MNLDRIKPETLAAGVMDYMPSQSAVAHEYAERLNAALARLGLTERLTLPPAPNTAIDELPAVVDVPLRKTLSVLMGKAQQGDASALATLEWTAQVAESIFAGLHARASVYPLALPSHESLATLSQGVDALLPRKISNGAWSLLADGTPSDGIDDGVSLVRLLCSSAADSVTELKDDNIGWTMTKRLPYYKNLHSITIGCKEIIGPVDTIRESLFYCTGEFRADELEYCMTAYYDVNLLNGGSGDTLIFPKLHTFGAGTYGSMIVNSDYRRIILPALKTYYINNHYYNLEALVRNSNLEILECPVLYGCASTNAKNVNLIANNPNLRYVDLRGFTKKNINIVRNCPQLETLILGKITEWSAPDKGDAAYHEFEKEENLIHLEFGEGSAASIKLTYWNPTSVLSDSERLPIFLSNFKTYIAERLSEQGSGLTLTLSQAVRDAIEGDPTIAQIITSKGWTISPAPSV